MENTQDDIAGFSGDDLKELFGRLRPIEPVPTDAIREGGLRTPLGGILFDIYGTLLISGSGDIGISRKSTTETREFQGLLHRFGISLPPKTVLDAFFNAIEEAHFRERRKGVDFPEVQVDQIWTTVLGMKERQMSRRFALEFELLANPVWPMPHLEALLASCRRARLPMGIISKAQFYTPLLMEWFLKKELPELGFRENLLFFSYKFNAAKPSPKLFNQAVSRLEGHGISPNAVLFLGNDMEKDIIPARQAGFQTALFAGDARSLRRRQVRSEYREIQPDLVITNLAELVPYIDKGGRHDET